MTTTVQRKEIREAALVGIEAYLRTNRATSYFGPEVTVVVIPPGNEIEVRFVDFGERTVITLEVS